MAPSSHKMLGEIANTQAPSIAHAILILAAVCCCGLAVGSIRYRGVSLGTAGVVFAGILFGHFGARIDHDILAFVREFGLVLFVFTIGLQLGPGFFAALRQQGAKLNLLAAAVVVLGVLVALGATMVLGVDHAAAIGVLSGATTNTPSLGAAQQALAIMPGVSGDQRALPALGYAVAYPVGIAGIIGSLIAIRLMFRINPLAEAEAFLAEQRSSVEPLERMGLVVENRSLDGVSLAQVPGRRETGVVISRVRSADSGEVLAATGSTVLHVGDILLAVGPRAGLEQFARIVGRASDVDLATSSGDVTSRRVVVTQKSVLGKSLAELGFGQLFGVTLTRIGRGDLEMSALPDLRLRFGDTVQVVGERGAIEQVAGRLGNSTRALNETQFIPLFLGIALGVALGLVPFTFPGLPVPVRLGLAGGPLVLGIVLSRLGHVGGLVWHVPHNANMAFREMGITLFLAAVGLMAGEHFFATVFSLDGLRWLICAVLIATIPLVAVGAFARTVMMMNYTRISGLLAGSTTDPPALAFAALMTRSEGPYVAYATVYPLTMLLRILSAQALAVLLFR